MFNNTVDYKILHKMVAACLYSQFQDLLSKIFILFINNDYWNISFNGSYENMVIHDSNTSQVDRFFFN